MRDKLFDDIAGMLGGAAGVMADMRDSVRSDMRGRLKGVADRIDLVNRDEYLALEARVSALEALLAASAQASPAPKKAAAKTAEAKKAPAKKVATKKATTKATKKA